MATLTLPDPYEGWSREDLLERVHELSGALMDWQVIAANMSVAPGALDTLTVLGREKVEAIVRAYSDDE